MLVIAALLGFSGGHALAAQSPQITNVSIVPGASDLTSTAYSPDVVTVVVGANNTVVWTNNDNVTHSANGKNTTFNSYDIAPGMTGRFTFTTPGTYPYYCFYHPNMEGKVIVKAGAAVTTTTSTTTSSSTSSTTSHTTSKTPTTTSTATTSTSSSITSSMVQSTSTSSAAGASPGGLPTTTILAGVAAVVAIAVVGFFLLRRRR